MVKDHLDLVAIILFTNTLFIDLSLFSHLYPSFLWDLLVILGCYVTFLVYFWFFLQIEKRGGVHSGYNQEINSRNG